MTKDEMSDEEFFVQAVPWLEGLLRRGMLCVAINLPATAITPAKDVFAHPEAEDLYTIGETQTVFMPVDKWDFEIEPGELERRASAANRSAE